jgi:hypothetical protein
MKVEQSIFSPVIGNTGIASIGLGVVIYDESTCG